VKKGNVRAKFHSVNVALQGKFNSPEVDKMADNFFNKYLKGKK